MPDTLMPCPFCQEPIQPLATKCRYCKEVLPDGWSNRPDVAVHASNAANATSCASSATLAPSAVAVSAPKSVAGYARACGVLALIAAILALVVPVVGVLWFSPLAIILGIVAMRGGARSYGIAVLVIVTVNMIISPTFWLNIGAGSTMPGASANRMITYINVFGVLGMIFMLFSGRLWTSVAAVIIGFVAIGLYGILKKPWFIQSGPSADGRGVQAPPIARRSSSAGPNARASKDAICDPAHSGEVTIIAGDVRDTYVGTTYQREGSPSGPTLSFGGWGDRYDAVVRFDLPNPPPPASSAVLCLFATTVPPNDPQLLIARILSAWEPASVNVRSMPRATEGSPAGPLNVGWNSFDITQLYETWTQHPDSNFGVQLRPTSTDQTNGSFASSRYPEAGKRPRIAVTLSRPATRFEERGVCVDVTSQPTASSERRVRFILHRCHGPTDHGMAFSLASRDRIEYVWTGGDTGAKALRARLGYVPSQNKAQWVLYSPRDIVDRQGVVLLKGTDEMVGFLERGPAPVPATQEQVAPVTSNTSAPSIEFVDSVYQNGTERLFQHILIEVKGNTPADTAAALQKVQVVLNELQKGADFGQIASRYSSDTLSGKDQGYLEPVRPGVLPKEFEAAAWGLGPGAVSGVVRTFFGFHIIRRPTPLDARPRLLRLLSRRPQ